MKALTLWQPWASLIAAKVKWIETRPWSTQYRGPLAIHAAKRSMNTDPEAMKLWWTYHDELVKHEDLVTWDTLPLGKVVATCELIDVVPTERIRWGLRRGYWYDPPGSVTFGIEIADDQRPVGNFDPGRFAWLLRDIEVVDPPIAATGRQQLWEWNR